MISEPVRFILEDLEQTQLQFIRKRKITQDEYRCATDTLVGSVAAGEGSLLYDVFLEAAATSARNIGTGGSLDAIEGRFYLPSAPGLEAALRIAPAFRRSRGPCFFFTVASSHRTARRWPASNWTCGSRTPTAITRTYIPTSQNAPANASIQVTMELSRSGRLFPRRMRSRRVVRPELCLSLLAGISLARNCSFALLNRGKESKLMRTQDSPKKEAEMSKAQHKI
jgi:hypothetical protein